MAGIKKEVWYSGGLRFECTQCGDCCSGSEGYVWVNQEEIDAMASRVGLEPKVFEEKYVKRVGVRRSLKERPGGDCVLLDEQTRKCTAYEERPRQCKTWPFWDSNIRTPEAWEETAQACPGCNKGNLVPLETIIEQASKIRI
jgi:Fe-S-cluster containining protein